MIQYKNKIYRLSDKINEKFSTNPDERSPQFTTGEIVKVIWKQKTQVVLAMTAFYFILI
jgi:hypothetical protein